MTTDKELDALVERLNDAEQHSEDDCYAAASAISALRKERDRLREALEKTAYLPGGWKEIEHIEYCRFCSYSRHWIAKHGHGNTRPLYLAPQEPTT